MYDCLNPCSCVVRIAGTRPSHTPVTSVFPVPPSLSHSHSYAPAPLLHPLSGPHRPRGYHWRAHGAIGGASITNAPPLAPSPLPSLTPSCSNTHTQPVCLPAVLAARYEQGQAARARGADTRKCGVLLTPPPLLKHSPQEAQCTGGGLARSAQAVGQTGLVWGSVHTFKMVFWWED